MSMPAYAPRRYWTETEFYSARDDAPVGERWELIDGRVLVTPTPHWQHQGIVRELVVLLHAYTRKTGIGDAYASLLDVRLEPGMVTQPDVLVVPSGHLRQRSDSISKLLLACEVVSRSSARWDRVVKRPHYQGNRVPEYWVIDSAARLIERWQQDDSRPDIMDEQLVWRPVGATAPFELDIQKLFRDSLPV